MKFYGLRALIVIVAGYLGVTLTGDEKVDAIIVGVAVIGAVIDFVYSFSNKKKELEEQKEEELNKEADKENSDDIEVKEDESK